MNNCKKGFWPCLESAATFVCRLASYIVPVILIGIMLLVTGNVVMRQVFHSPINGVNEIVECAIAAAGFLSLGWATINGMHVAVDIVTRKSPPKFAAALEACTSFVSFLITPVLAYCSYQRAMTAFVKMETSTIMKLQMYPVYGLMFLGYCALVLAQLVITVNNFRKVGKKNDDQ